VDLGGDSIDLFTENVSATQKSKSKIITVSKEVSFQTLGVLKKKSLHRLLVLRLIWDIKLATSFLSTSKEAQPLPYTGAIKYSQGASLLEEAPDDGEWGEKFSSAPQTFEELLHRNEHRPELVEVFKAYPEVFPSGDRPPLPPKRPEFDHMCTPAPPFARLGWDFDSPIFKTDPAQEKAIYFSITIGMARGDKDVDVDKHWPKFQYILHKAAGWGIAGLERGACAGRLHIQACLLLRCATATAVTLAFKSYFKECGFVGADTLRIKTRELQMVQPHTPEGMIGYCTKDKGQAWYKEARHGISPADVEEGQEVYLKHAKEKIREAVWLTTRNLLPKMHHFWSTKMAREEGAEARVVIEEMLFSGMFLLSSDFFTGTKAIFKVESRIPPGRF